PTRHLRNYKKIFRFALIFCKFANPRNIGCKCKRRHNQTEKPKKQTILTGDRRTGNDIQNGQRVSRHSLSTLLYFLFSPPHIFFNSILLPPHKRHIGFCPNRTSQGTDKSQRAVFCQRTSEIVENNLITFYLKK
ncbi:MAG: hypothetical protein SFU27_14300, partial [Thermonemataceae bacterium]|nr:hypothetical protein [Thermonemataceae bacterium]